MFGERVLWRVELLGRFRLRREAQIWERLQTRKTESLLAYLILHPGPQPREVLCDVLWPDTDRDAARNRLSQAISWLRPRLESNDIPTGQVLLADRQTIGLNTDSISSDVVAFEAAVAQAQWQEAIALYQGNLLPALDDEWILSERERLKSAFFTALQQLLSTFEQSHDWESALTLARQALTHDPLSEELHSHVIRLLMHSGQQSEAHRAYRAWESLLGRTLQQTPSPDVRALLDASPLPVPVLVPTQMSLPTPLTRFFGRTTELESLRQRLLTGEVRLMTLTGLGGTGKTRLAIELAHQFSVLSSQSVYFVPLADLRDASLIPTAIADTIKGKGPRGSDILKEVITALQGTTSLLILDNVEHVSEDVAPILRALLDGVPTLTVVITSRHLLGLMGEQEVAVAPLPVPAGAPTRENLPTESYPSVQLFLDRARAVRPDLQLTPENAPIIAALCTRLEGWPLAIELCAAWAQTLTPAQMLDHLNRRFDLLVSRRRDIPARHRTLRATLEYSYLLLPESLQQLLLHLSVFRGGWTLEAAVAVCGNEHASPLEMLHAITELRERSLVLAVPSVGDTTTVSEMRYSMLESVQDFASEQQPIAESTRFLRRHFEYFTAITIPKEWSFDGPTPALPVRRLAEEWENLRAALTWAEDSDLRERGLALAIVLTSFWEMYGDAAEGKRWLKRYLHSCGETLDESLRARALLAYGQLARAHADFEEAETVLQEALTLFRGLKDNAGIAHTLMIRGTLANIAEENEQARALLDMALLFARQQEDPSLIARVLANLGNVLMDECDWPQAWTIFQEVLTFRRSEGNIKRLASTLNNLGLVARYQGDYSRALPLLEEGLRLARELDDRPGIGISQLNIATVHRLADRLPEARHCLAEALRLTFRVEDRRAFAWCIKEAGHLACAASDFDTGILLLGAAEHFRGQFGITFKPADPTERQRDTERALVALGTEPFSVQWQQGSMLTLDAAYRVALQKCGDYSDDTHF